MKGPLAAMAALVVATPMASIAAEAADSATVEKVELGPPPSDFGLTYFYYNDAEKLVKQMRYAVQLEKGNPNLPSVSPQKGRNPSPCDSFEWFFLL